jgi:hypothetical protein
MFLSATSTMHLKRSDFAVGQWNVPVADRKFPVGEGKFLIRDCNFGLPDVENCGT